MTHAEHEHGQPEGASHAPPQPDDKVHTYHQVLGIALRELLVEKGVVTAEELREMLEKREATTPAEGARVVARAWLDEDFRVRLLENGNAAVAELGLEMSTAKLVALENTDRVHNVVVCTLCSCYPREILGLPPSWYKSRAYRARVVREPRTVLAELGTVIATEVDVRVHDSTADVRYLVVPRRPEGTDGMAEAELAELVTRDAMVGVAGARLPGT